MSRVVSNTTDITGGVAAGDGGDVAAGDGGIASPSTAFLPITPASVSLMMEQCRMSYLETIGGVFDAILW